jgi:4-hydroxybenzoate polyprenyltransferase
VQILYWIFNITGILLGVYVAYQIGKINYSLVFVFAAGLLWFYSERYQCQPIIGNMVVSFLSALTIAIVWLFSFFALIRDPVFFTSVQQQFSSLNVFILIFSVFAFLTSFVREMVKDMQDIEGDDRFGCTTFPVVYGIKKAKWIAVLTVFLSLVLSIWCQLYFAAAAYQKLFCYFFIIDLLFVVAGYMIFKAKMNKDFKKVSGIIKLLMIMGILSMVLVYFEY